MNLIKLIKYGEYIGTATKFPRLKSTSIIEDNYLETLQKFAVFTGKQLCWSVFLIKLQAFRSAILKKRLQHRCFPVHIANVYLRTYIWINIEFISAKF